MPKHIRARCAWQFNNSDPKNQAIINPCFRHQADDIITPGPNGDALANDLATALDTTFGPTQITQLTVSLYDIEGTKPVYPFAKVVKRAGTFVVPGLAPQLALCLSFFSGQNIPRKRGRLYVPGFLLTPNAVNPVTAAVRTKVAGLVPIFASLGGINVDWIVWSGAAHAAGRVDNWWVDDSWDVQRSRKLKTLTRDVGTTGG